jgi:hypothetical protein
MGSFAAWRLKNYLAEEEAKKRLKNSIINKSNLATKTSTLILNSKKEKNL